MIFKKLTIVFVTVYSAVAYGQVAEIRGDFGNSVIFASTKLSILDDGKFTLKESSDIGARRITGKWTKQESILTLVPTESSYYSLSDEKWKEIKNPTEGFFYSKIKILSVDKLYVENDESHVHLNRLPTDQDGPHKIHFPNQKIFVPDSKDSVLVKKIMQYIKKWPYEHGYTIQLSGQTSEEDDKMDKYIGLKRCRSIVRYFQEQIGIGWNDFVIKDLDHGDQKGDSFVEIKILHDYP